MCGQSAKLWNTVPIRPRAAASCARDIGLAAAPSPMRPIGWPPSSMVPLPGTSSQLIQRSSVDLPEPLGPSRQVVVPCGTSKLMSRRISTPS